MKLPILLSYPRSGNHWVRYILEYMSGQPTLGADNHGIHSAPVCARGIGLEHVNRTKPFVCRKRHRLARNDPRDVKLMVIVRNYKEVIMRHQGGSINDAGAREHQADFYLHSLIHFDGWGCEDKKLVYYEDLIDNDLNLIKSIVDFFDIEYEDDDWKYFVDNYESIRENSVKTYPRTYGKPPSVTKGKKKIFHSKDLSIEQKKEWDSLMRRKNLHIFNTYLTRYAEI